MKIFNEITIVIVTFRSDKIIKKTINSIDKNFNIIISENSNRFFFKKNIEKEFLNCKVILTGANLGVSGAVNIALNDVKTKYALFLTPDTFLKKNTLNKIYDLAQHYKNAAIISPKNISSNPKYLYGFFRKINNKKNEDFFYNDILKVDWVSGGALLLNMKFISLVNYFDQNFFLDFEEIDLCYRLRKKKFEIIFSNKLLMSSKPQSSVSSLNKKNIKYQRMWHYGWSSFYFYNKNFGFFYSIKKNFVSVIKSFIKMLIHFFLNNKQKFFNHFYYLFGFTMSLLKKNSYLRKKI
jgi:N-acetylglucosaminyl-diphospho-decaprenol L-rhamnosyltransferase